MSTTTRPSRPACGPLLGLTLLAIPALAAADEKLTYECTGYLSAESAGAQAIRPITLSYTLVLSGTNGRYFDWEERQWQPIHLITDTLFQLYAGQQVPALHASATASIDRRSGQLHISYTGGTTEASVGGRCAQVPLREPPPEH